MANWWGLLASCQVSVRGHKEKTPNKQTHCKSTHWKWGLSYCLFVLLMLLRAIVSVFAGWLFMSCVQLLLLSNLSNARVASVLFTFASEDAGQKWRWSFVAQCKQTASICLTSVYVTLCHLICVNNIVEVKLVRVGVLPHPLCCCCWNKTLNPCQVC